MDFEFSLDNINDVAKKCWDVISDHHVMAFHGEMGVGKTTLIHAMCDVKGVKDVVGSPTFSIINEYSFDQDNKENKIFHIDLFRLRDENEAIQAGVEDCLYSDHICLVEWPEKAPVIFPEDTIHLYLSVSGTNSRKLRISNN